MNPSSPRAAPPAPVDEGRRIGIGVLITAGLLAALLLAAPVGAQESDTSAPTLAGGERVNATTIHVTVADDTDVEEDSVDATDFSLNDGDVAAVNATERGSDANVKLFLDERVNTDEITVAIASDGNVTDAAGNALTNGSVTVTGMDSYLPQLKDYRVERVNESAARIVVRSSEPLSELRLQIYGAATANLTREDFKRVDDNRFGTPYVRTHQFPADGTYRLRLASLVDKSGHLVNYSRDRTFVRDASGPTAAIDGPTHLDTGDLGRFDGSDSIDNVAVTRYEWTVDGEDAGEGSVFEHGFDEAGTHEVGLTVADERGNLASANWSVVVHQAVSKRGVTVTTRNDSSRHAVVWTNRTDERVRIADEYGRLAGDDDVTVRSLTVTLPTDETLRLNVSGNATAPSFESATGREALAAVSIAHGNRTVADPTFRFSVSAARLSRAGISYSDVALYRDDGNWTELPTEVVRATKSTVVYEADSPGLSTFVVGASGANGDWENSGEELDAGGSAAIRVTDATLVSETVAFGEYAVVEATLTNDGDGRGTFVTGLTVGPEVVSTRPVFVPAGETTQISIATRAVRNGTVTVNGTIAGELRVAGARATATEIATDGQPTGTDESGELGEGNDNRDGGFDVPIPNPLALWPDGLVGTILTALVGGLVGLYVVLKALAIHLGY